MLLSIIVYIAKSLRNCDSKGTRQAKNRGNGNIVPYFLNLIDNSHQFTDYLSWIRRKTKQDVEK